MILAYIASGNGGTKNQELFISLLDYILENNFFFKDINCL